MAAVEFPWAALIGGLALICGAGLTCYGVFILAGLGWALLVAAIPFLTLAVVIFRGLLRGK